MKKFSGFYRMQTCTQANSRYAADPAPERLLPLPGGTQTHGIAFAAKAAALYADMAALSCPGWKAAQPDIQHTPSPGHDPCSRWNGLRCPGAVFPQGSGDLLSIVCKRVVISQTTLKFPGK